MNPFYFYRVYWVSMSKTPSSPLQIKNWARCLGSLFYPFQRKSYILSISFLIYFGIVYIWPMCHCLDKRVWSTIIWLCSRYGFFYYTFTYFMPVIKVRVSEINSKCFNGKLWPSHLSCWLILFLYAPTHKARILKSLSLS